MALIWREMTSLEVRFTRPLVTLGDSCVCLRMHLCVCVCVCVCVTALRKLPASKINRYFYNLNRAKFCDSQVREWIYWQQDSFAAARSPTYGRLCMLWAWRRGVC